MRWTLLTMKQDCSILTGVAKWKRQVFVFGETSSLSMSRSWHLQLLGIGPVIPFWKLQWSSPNRSLWPITSALSLTKQGIWCGPPLITQYSWIPTTTYIHRKRLGCTIKWMGLIDPTMGEAIPRERAYTAESVSINLLVRKTDLCC